MGELNFGCLNFLGLGTQLYFWVLYGRNIFQINLAKYLMETSELNRVSLASQIQLDDLALIKKKGFETIINNRPDNEVPNQPSDEEISVRAREQGLSYFYIPILPSGISAKNIEETIIALEQTQGPVLAFCRSGTRSGFLLEILKKELEQNES